MDLEETSLNVLLRHEKKSMESGYWWRGRFKKKTEGQGIL